MKLTIAARALFFLIFVIVTWLILTPDTKETEPGMDVARWLSQYIFGNPNLGDKVAHFLAFGSLGAVAALARLKIAKSGVLVIAALAVYGGLLEIGQLLGGVRDAEVMDAVADAIGAGVCYPAMAFAVRFMRERFAS